MATRISNADIRDSLIKGIVQLDSSYLTLADQKLELKCREKGISLEEVPQVLPFEVKEWLLAEIGYMVCMDKSGIPPRSLMEGDVQYDPYMEKLRVYKSSSESLNKAMTVEMLTGVADTPREFSSIQIRLNRG